MPDTSRDLATSFAGGMLTLAAGGQPIPLTRNGGDVGFQFRGTTRKPGLS